MKYLHIILIISFVLIFSQCTSSLDLLGGLLDTLTKNVENITTPLVNTTTALAGTLANTTLGAIGDLSGTVGDLSGTVGDLTGTVGGLLGTLGSTLGSAVNLVTTIIAGATGGIVQVIGDIPRDVSNEVGVLVSGTLGLTSEMLKALQIYDESKWPSLYPAVDSETVNCIREFALEFQTFYPETVRLSGNGITEVEYFYDFVDYCRHPDTDTEITQCMRILREALANTVNKFAVDGAMVNYKLKLQWAGMLERRILQCVFGD